MNTSLIKLKMYENKLRKYIDIVKIEKYVNNKTYYP